MSDDENAGYATINRIKLRGFLLTNASHQIGINLQLVRAIMTLANGGKPSPSEIQDLLNKIDEQRNDLVELMATVEGGIE